MNIEISEALWLDISKIYTLTEITELSGLPLTLLNQLIELDAIPACDDIGSAFDTKALERACAARRLHHDLVTGTAESDNSQPESLTGTNR